MNVGGAMAADPYEYADFYDGLVAHGLIVPVGVELPYAHAPVGSRPFV